MSIQEPDAIPHPVRPSGGCFLCAYAGQICDVSSVDGSVAGALERRQGSRHPLLAIQPEHGERIVLSLDPRERAVMRALAGLPREQRERLRVRVYHLHGNTHQVAADVQGPASGRAGGSIAADVAHAPAETNSQRLRASPATAIVLEPDLLLNITDINHAEYCVRQYVLRRMVPSPPTAATLRGTILHGAFKELLKGRSEDPQSLLAQALRAQTADLAIRQIAPADVAADAEPHLAALSAWYTHQRQNNLWTSTPNVRVETFVLAPEVGLKGRMDALWEDEQTSKLLELKTSTVRGELPRREHRWQVYGYQTLLAARSQGEKPKGATLLYSGTPGQAEEYRLPFHEREIYRVLELRNLLAIAHATGSVPPPPGGRQCGRCPLRADCLRTSPLLGWEPPPSDEQPEPVEAPDAAWFARYYELLRLEGRASEEQMTGLWRIPPEQRRAGGVAIGGLELVGEPRITESGEWQYTFRCRNDSELRENDPVLLSDGDPIHGAAVTGTLLSVTDREVVVWTPERIARPALIDRYGSDIVHDRTVRNLWRWLSVEPRLRALVRGAAQPACAEENEGPAIAGFNPEQQLAVRRALAADDFLLIQGPPGTGKTRVVAEIVRQFVTRRQRVLVAAFTNQAVDNVLARLAADGFHDFVRLGHELSVAPALRGYRLAARAEAARSAAGTEMPAEAGDGHAAEPERIRAALVSAPVVASTTATWSAERYDEGGPALEFDVAVVDEASQLTVPALLGALRFARRFVLVGDERQLPPLVVSPEAAAGGLARSLFAQLHERWGERASVTLVRQYRMHPAICAFPSQEFYGGRLVTDGPAQTALLALQPAPSDGLEAVLAPERPLVFVDVPAGVASASGKSSQAQAHIVRRLVLGLRRRGLAAERIGVIAPFRAQVAAIRKALAASGELGITVDTVDRFQGGEREAIVLAFALQGAQAANLAAASFVADANRLNVALTRAQRKLILVGDAHALRETPLLVRLVAHCETLYGGRGGLIRAHIGPER